MFIDLKFMNPAVLDSLSFYNFIYICTCDKFSPFFFFGHKKFVSMLKACNDLNVSTVLCETLSCPLLLLFINKIKFKQN